MKAFGDAGYRKKNLIKLNRCRLYLHVKTLSDITDGNGDRIRASSYNGEKCSMFNTATHDWPEQTNPDKSHWTLWRQALRRSFARTTTQRLGILTHPVGTWIDGARETW